MRGIGFASITGVIALASLAGGVACESERIAVSSARAGFSPGHQQLLEAVARYSRGDHSPAAFRALATTAAELAPRLAEDGAAEAERHLVFLALEPLDALADQPWDVQRDRLALEVWPTALGIEPEPDESPTAYTERVCAAQLAEECQYVVPEYRSLILLSVVWRRFAERAREALTRCPSCQEDTTYVARLGRYEAQRERFATLAARYESAAHPRSWPRAGSRAAPWSGAVLLAVSPTGEATLDGRSLEPGGWRRDLAEHHAASVPASSPASAISGALHASVLGVHLAPSARVRELRDLLADAVAAGFTQIALLVRRAEYPYPRAEYRIATRRAPGQKPVSIRNGDTIQVLVQALDARDDGAPLPAL